VSIYDTYRVVTTNKDGTEKAGNLWDRDIAMAIFGAVLATADPKPARVRVVSEKTWRESLAVKWQ
jgi:hypothetical protein